MPVDRANKKFDCDYPGCGKAFGRPYDLQRHKQVHCIYEERHFACPVAGCGFRANQKGGLKCHTNSIHENLRLPCGEAGCAKTFSDPSSRSKHRGKCHTTADKAGGSFQRARIHKKKHSAAYPVSVILDQFSTFAVRTSNPATPSSADGSSSSTRQSASRSAPSGPSTSVYRPNYTTRYELPGVFHGANDVQSDGWSVDQNIQKEHQAYNANPWAAPTAWGYYPILTRPQVPTLHQLQHPDPVQGDFDLSCTAHDQSCRCWDCVVGDVTMAPLRG